MKCYSVISVLLLRLSLGAAAAAAAAEQGEVVSVELMAAFRSWSDDHGKDYDSHEEKMKRLRIWLNNDGTFFPVACLPPRRFAVLAIVC